MTNFERCPTMLMTLLCDVDLGLSLPLRRTIATVTACLLEGTDAHLSDLADALPDIESDQMVKEQRLRRLLSHPDLSPQRLLPAYLHILRPLLQTLPELVLSMDRTKWKKRQRQVNILMVSVHFHGRTLPLFWTVRDDAVHFGFKEWKTVLQPVITDIQADQGLREVPLVVTEYREFASPQLAEWLMCMYHVDSVLRLKRSEYLCDQSQDITLSDLVTFFPRGETRYSPHTTATKTNRWLVNMTITWAAESEDPLLLMSTLGGGSLSLTTYQCRFGIEAMFTDQKSNGLNVEQTKVTAPKRIEILLMLTTFALAVSFLSDSSPSNTRFAKRTNRYSHHLSTVCHYL